MSEKINIKLPEVATALLRLKQRSEDEKKSEEQKRSAEIIKDYAYVLGWYTTEDGPIDVEKVQRGLVELVDMHEKAFGGPGRDYGVYRRSGNAGHTGAYYYESDGSLSVKALKELKYKEGEIEFLQAIHGAYKLLENMFEDFNGFVSEIWKEFDGERREAFNSEVTKWEKEKEVFEKGVKDEASQLLRESVEAALVAKNEARLAEGKKKVGVLKFEERYPIESEIREKQSEKKFVTPKPVLTENQVHSRMKAQKLDLEELEREVGKLEK